MSSQRNILIWLLILFVAAPSQVFAYTDPGSGTLLWQMIVAGSIGLAFYFRRMLGWARLLKDRSKNRATQKQRQAH